MNTIPATPGAQPGSDGFRTVNPTAANAAIGMALRIASISGNLAATEWHAPGGPLTVTEVDGTPSFTATTIRFPNGTVTDAGSGIAAIDVATSAQGALASSAVQPAAISNVNNTSDAGKPVSTAQQTALDLKANLTANTFTGTQNFGGQQVEGMLNKVIAAVSGSLTTTAHSGNVLLTTGNVTAPTTAGFNCILVAGGAHTVTFNATASAAMSAGDVMTLFVQSGTVIQAVLTKAADKVSFA